MQLHLTKNSVRVAQFYDNFIKIQLQFGSFKIYFIKIHLSFKILRNISENSTHFFAILRYLYSKKSLISSNFTLSL